MNPSVKEFIVYWPVKSVIINQLDGGNLKKDYMVPPDDYEMEKYGFLKDIVAHTIFDISDCPEKFSLESIEKKKNELKAHRNKIDRILLVFLIEYFPIVLIPLIIDYCL